MDVDMNMEIDVRSYSDRFLKVCGSCNGLLCFSNFEDEILLWNPAIGEIKELPPPPFEYSERLTYRCLAIGFGFDSITNVYKVVAVVRYTSESSENDEYSEFDKSAESSQHDESDESSNVDQSSEAGVHYTCESSQNDEYSESDQSPESSQHDESDESSNVDQSSESNGSFDDSEFDEDDIGVGIYNMSTNSWTKVDHKLDYLSSSCELLYGPQVSGALHWLFERRGEGKHILSFNMSTEEFGYIKLPYDPFHKYGIGDRMKLAVLNESLSLLVSTYVAYQAQFVDVWVMHEYGNAKSWTMQVRIGPMTGIDRPILLWKNESVLLKTGTGRLVSCNFDTPEISGPEIDGIGLISGCHIYYESLVSVA